MGGDVNGRNDGTNDGAVGAREALDRSDGVRRSASRVARAAARAQFARIGIFVAGAVAVIGVANLWVPAGWPRTAVVAVATFGMVLLLMRATQRGDVRVVPSRRAVVAVTLAGGALVVGATALADSLADRAVAVAVSVLVSLVVWAAAAWWVGR